MAEQKKTKKQQADEQAVADKIASWPAPYAKIGKRLHEVITEADPELQPRLWYGSAGYAKGGPVVVFFRLDDRFSFGLTEKAHAEVEDGAADLLVPSAWYLSELDDATEQRIAQIVKRAAG